MQIDDGYGIYMLMHYAGKIKDDKHIKFKEAAGNIVDGIKPDMFASNMIRRITIMYMRM